MYNGFRVFRDGLTVIVSGVKQVKFAWSAKTEILSPSQAGVLRSLADHGFEPVKYYYPPGFACGSAQWDAPTTKGWFSGDRVRCVSEEAAVEAVAILTERIAPHGQQLSPASAGE